MHLVNDASDQFSENVLIGNLIIVQIFLSLSAKDMGLHHSF